MADFYAQYYEEYGSLYQLDGWDDCIIGAVPIDNPQPYVDEGEDAEGYRLVYSSTKIIQRLQDESEEMTYEDAVEFYEYNIVGVLPAMKSRQPLLVSTPHVHYMDEAGNLPTQ